MQSLLFQNVDAIGNDLDVHPANEPVKSRRYVMTLFGRCADGKSCAVEIHGFRPYMFVALDHSGPEDEMSHLVKSMGARVGNGRSNTQREESLLRAAEYVGIESWEVVRRRRFRGFEDNRERTFLRVNFYTRAAMRKAISKRYECYEDGQCRPRPGAPALYESNIDPLVRFIDIAGIEPCNWIVVSNAKRGFCGSQTVAGGVNAFSASYESVRPPTVAERGTVPVFAPLRSLLFDLECESSHGAFPLAIKGYTRVAHDVVDLAGKIKDPSELSACVHRRLLAALDPTDADKRLYLSATIGTARLRKSTARPFSHPPREGRRSRASSGASSGAMFPTGRSTCGGGTGRSCRSSSRNASLPYFRGAACTEIGSSR